MYKNIGLIDKIFRVIFAIVLLWLGIVELGGQDGNYIGVLVALASFIPLTFMALGTCPVYRILGFNTISRKKRLSTVRSFRKNKNN